MIPGDAALSSTAGSPPVDQHTKNTRHCQPIAVADFPWPEWTTRENGTERKGSVWDWQELFAIHGRHAFQRRGTVTTGIAVGLAMSMRVTYDPDRGDFAETFVSQQTLAEQLGGMKPVRLAEYLHEGEAAGWWVLEDRGKGRSKLIRLTVPSHPWWLLHQSERPARPRGEDGRFLPNPVLSEDQVPSPPEGPCSGGDSRPDPVHSEDHPPSPPSGPTPSPPNGGDPVLSEDHYLRSTDVDLPTQIPTRSTKLVDRSPADPMSLDEIKALSAGDAA